MLVLQSNGPAVSLIGTAAIITGLKARRVGWFPNLVAELRSKTSSAVIAAGDSRYHEMERNQFRSEFSEQMNIETGR